MSTPAHTVLGVQQFLTTDGLIPVPLPPSSLNLTPRDFVFVSLDEKALRGKCFAYMEEVKQKMAEALKGIKIDEFKNCFEQWRKSQ